MKRLLCCLLCALMLSFAGCHTPEPSADIAATTLPVYQFTTILCQGTNLSVARLIQDHVSCLHDYTLQVSQVKAVESAAVVVISGAGLEDFMADLLDGTAVIDSSAGISLLESCHEHEHAEEHGHHHEHDSHIWLSPKNAMQMAKNICIGLSEQFPEHAADFERNLTDLLQNLQALDAYATQTLSTLTNRELITFHDGFSYLADAYQLTILAAVEEESGSEASAQELIHLIRMVQEHKLPAVFQEINGSASGARVIAAETGCELYALDMAMAGTDYFEAMYHNIDTLKEALK